MVTVVEPDSDLEYAGTAVGGSVAEPDQPRRFHAELERHPVQRPVSEHADNGESDHADNGESEHADNGESDHADVGEADNG